MSEEATIPETMPVVVGRGRPRKTIEQKIIEINTKTDIIEAKRKAHNDIMKKYYHDNKDERQKYNRKYWASNGQKYVEKRMKDPDYVSKYTEYNKIYRERSKQIYVDNRKIIMERNKQYYYDNRQERLKYNNQYWSVNGHKYKGRSKHIYQDNFFHATSLKDFIVTFD